MIFSSPVNNITIFIAGAGIPGNENFIITTNTGIPSVTSNVNCYTTIIGNEILSGLNADSGGGGGGGKFFISNSSTFTTLTITGDGGQSGSLLSICSDSLPTVIPCTPSCGAWSYTYTAWSAWSTCDAETQTRTRTANGTRTCILVDCSTNIETSSTIESESQACVMLITEFITLWKTDNAGTSGSNQITIPINNTGFPSVYVYNYAHVYV